jgi:hypothetical protein
MDYSSDSLIATVRLRAGIPEDALVSDAQILEAINYELRETILPMIIRAGAEYYVTYKDFPISDSGIYEIPPLAVGKKLRDIHIVGNDSDENQRNVISVLPQLFLPNIAQNQQYNFYRYYDQYGFIVQGNKIKTYPINAVQTGYIRMYYYRRPNLSVLKSQGAAITVLNSTEFSVAAVPSGWSSSPNIDIIQQDPSFDCVEQNLVSSISGTTFTVSSTANMTSGDYVNLTGETSFPQMPVDLQNMLIQSVCMRMYEIIRDEKRLQLASAMYDKMKLETMDLISPRVDGRTIKITSKNSIGYYTQ